MGVTATYHRRQLLCTMQIKGPDPTAVHGKRAWGLDASFSVLPNATVGRLWSFLSACFHTVLLAFHWHCPQFRIVCGTRFMYLSCVCLSVCLSQLSIAAAACGGFAAVGPAGGRYRSIAARPALSSSRAAERRSSGVRRVCCCGPGGREISIDCCTSGAQQQLRR